MRTVIDILLILIVLDCTHWTLTDIVKPKFCQRERFDGIWNFGPNLEIIWREAPERRWVWQYNNSLGTFNEQPELEYTRGQDTTTLTTLYMPELPKCISAMRCDRLESARQLIFVRERPVRLEKESTTVYRVIGQPMSHYDTKWIQEVTRHELPWGLTDANQVWPNKEWSNQPYKSRNSVYLPFKGTVLYIVWTLRRDLSKLLYNSIANDNWFSNMKEVSLNSGINFVGMFHFKEMAYAIGEDIERGDYETRVYSVIFDGDKPELSQQVLHN